METSLETDFQESISLVSKETDDRGNGKYIFSLDRNNEIEFTVIKQGGNWSNDFKHNKFRYYFNQWDSTIKEKFEVKESKEQEFLYYEVAYKIDQYEDLEEAISDMKQFVDYAGEDYQTSWQYYIQNDSLIIFPFNIQYISEEDALREAKREYVNNRQKNNIEEKGITQEVLETYWRPDYLNLQINGELVKDELGNNITIGQHEMKYQIFLTENLLNAIPEVTVNAKSHDIISFSYKGKEYIRQDKTDLSKNEFRYILTGEEFEEIFDTTIVYDYKNELAKIEIK